jgi:hypothetical protein
MSQVRAFDELRDDEAQALIRSSNVMNWNDVGVIETRKDAGFGEVRLGIGDSIGKRHLDGDRAF